MLSLVVTAPAPFPDQQAAPFATRYDKLAVRYEAILRIAAINNWLITSLWDRR